MKAFQMVVPVWVRIFAVAFALGAVIQPTGYAYSQALYGPEVEIEEPEDLYYQYFDYWMDLETSEEEFPLLYDPEQAPPLPDSEGYTEEYYYPGPSSDANWAMFDEETEEPGPSSDARWGIVDILVEELNDLTENIDVLEHELVFNDIEDPEYADRLENIILDLEEEQEEVLGELEELLEDMGFTPEENEGGFAGEDSLYL